MMKKMSRFFIFSILLLQISININSFLQVIFLILFATRIIIEKERVSDDAAIVKAIKFIEPIVNHEESVSKKSYSNLTKSKAMLIKLKMSYIDHILENNRTSIVLKINKFSEIKFLWYVRF